jgi:hypothetical protein
MRSSKSRSRSKNNRNRSVGNIVNRVFDSSGPEGKVRGTPQQIIDKYNQLARDAQLGNDRVAAENFQQHAEHYTRLLGEALREAEAQREQREAQGQQQNRERSRDDPRYGSDDARYGQDNARAPWDIDPAAAQSMESQSPSDSEQPEAATRDAEQTSKPQPQAPESDVLAVTDVSDPVADGGDSGLVETPEDAAAKEKAAAPAPKKPRRTRKPKAPPKRAGSEDGGDAESGSAPSDSGAADGESDPTRAAAE